MTRFSMKRAANLSIDAALLEQARSLDINLSQVMETALRQTVAEQRASRWRQENAAALDRYNAWIAEHGLPLDRYRQF
jgi:antitoxin CcdA